MPISEAGQQPDTGLQPVRLLGVEFAPGLDRAEEPAAPAPVNERVGWPAAPEPNIERRELPDIPPAATRWHRIVNGDSLQSIAKMYFGDEAHALLIYNTNHGILDSPEFLPIGVELRIPDRVPPPASPLAPAPSPEPAQPLVPARIPVLPKAIKELSPLPDSLGWRRPPDKERGLNGL
jgi:phage tail protein X